MRTEGFSIEGTARGTPGAALMEGPMLQAVLEDRFKVKVHYERRDAPVDELVVGKGGPKLSQSPPGGCVPTGSSWPPLPLEPGQHRCRVGTETNPAGDFVMTVEGMTLDEVFGAVNSGDDRPVVNKTGLNGRFDFRLVYAGGSDTFWAAVRDQLGLDVRATRAPRDFVVVDRAERPGPNRQ